MSSSNSSSIRSLKCWYLSTKVHVVTFQKTKTLVISTILQVSLGTEERQKRCQVLRPHEPYYNAFNTAWRLWKGQQLNSAQTMFQQNIMKYKQNEPKYRHMIKWWQEEHDCITYLLHGAESFLSSYLVCS